MSASDSLGLQAGLPGRPLWLTTFVFAALATVAVCLPAWPGHMGYDPLFAYKESIDGIETMTWPPMHAYLFWLSRAAGAGPGGLFAAQAFILFFASGIALSLLIPRRALAVAAMIGFGLLFVAVPPMLGGMMSLWRDVITTSFAMAAVALWLLAARYRSLALIGLAALMIGACVALRYNAFPLFGLIAPMMVWRPFLAPRPGLKAHAFTAAALVVSIGLAWASTQWRLPDLKRLPPPENFAGIQLFDLLGISACAGHSYVPRAVTAGWPLTGEQVREIYDPRHLNRAFREIPGVPRVLPTDGQGRVQEVWRETVPKEFGCYVAHRNAVFVQQIGIARGEVFYPVHGRIDDNAYGLALAHPWANAQVLQYVERASPNLWQRPALLYLAAAAIVAALAWRRDGRTLLATTILGGAFANVVLLYLIGPAADARYILPSNVFCALLIAGGLAMLAEPRRAKAA